MADTDSLHRFVFENAGIRGNLVHLDASWRAVLDIHPYPPAVREPLLAELRVLDLPSDGDRRGQVVIVGATGRPRWRRGRVPA